MSQPFVGQVIAVGFNFAPVNWALCDGSLLQISEFSTLYNLIGTTFGGNGTTNFALPDLRGRAALGVGQGPGLQPYVQGQTGGVEFGHAHERPNRKSYAWAPGSGDGDHADAQFSGRSRHARCDHADLRDRRDAHRPRDQHSRAQRRLRSP